MSGFTPEEWRTAARVARRSIFTEGNPDLADAWEKAAYQAEARLIPPGCMALTAEQVEDVRHDGWVGSDTYMAMRKVGISEETAEAAMDYMKSVGLVVRRKGVRITPSDWLNPAPAEPAEEEKPVKFRKMAAKYATVNFGFPDVTDPCTCFIYAESAGKWTPYMDSDGDKWIWNGDQWELHIIPPAPAKPAEEEAHIEKSVHKGALAKLLEGILEADDDGWHLPNGWFPTDLAEAIVYAPSSPVVPAPTETGPWQSLNDVPAEVSEVWDANGDGWLRHSGTEWHGCAEGGITSACRAGHPNLAPFVAAEEG